MPFDSSSFLLPKPISSENVSMPLEISYSPVGIGQLRLWLLFGEAMENMRKLGED